MVGRIFEFIADAFADSKNKGCWANGSMIVTQQGLEGRASESLPVLDDHRVSVSEGEFTSSKPAVEAQDVCIVKRHSSIVGERLTRVSHSQIVPR